MPLTDSVQPGEPLARYLWRGKRKTYDPESRIVLWDAFAPSPKDNKTSVYRTLEQTEAEIWAKGQELTKKPDRPLAGRADLDADVVIRENLILEPEPLPNRHTNISGWPGPERAISIAQVLAAASTLVLL